MRRLPLAALAPLLTLACTSTAPSEEAAEEHPHGAVARWARRLDEQGRIPPGAIMRMAAQRDAMLATQPMNASPGLTNWRWLGPGNIGGRIRSIVIDPVNPSRMWVGSVSGGVWHTTNGGASWAPQDGFLSTLAICCMAMDPKNPNHIYAGTGEGFFDTVQGTSNLAAIQGAGIFETTDGGKTWKQLASTNNASFWFVNRIAIDPTDSKKLLAATARGIFRSTDGGSTWSQRRSGITFDIQIHPTDSRRAVAGIRNGSPVYTTDAGLTWRSATGISSVRRTELRYARDPNIVYAAVTTTSSRILIYKSVDGGVRYFRQTSGGGITTYSRYNVSLWADPADTNRLLVGGVRLYRSTNGGVSLVRNDSGTHADHHITVSHPRYDGVNNRTVFTGNDGGIHRTTDVARSSIIWQELNNNLGITQFYGAAIGPTGIVYGGTQDNGTLRYTGNKEGWSKPFGGDGGFGAADPVDPNYLYGETQRLRIHRSTNAGRSASYIYASGSNRIVESRPNFIPPFILDPNDRNRMLAGGAALWRSDNVRARVPDWFRIKAPLPCNDAHFAADPPCNIASIAVAPGDSDRVWVGHNNGDLYRTPNGRTQSPLWIRTDRRLPNRWLSRIAVDRKDNDKVYVTFMGYTRDNVWFTLNSGMAWNNIGRGLPAVPVTSIAPHQRVPGCLFVGTDLGVFWTADNGTTWQVVTEGPKNLPVEELVWKDEKTLLIVTHGRGCYLADVAPVAGLKTVGKPCGKRLPSLAATEPVLGEKQIYLMTNAPATSPVSLLLAPGRAKPFDLGRGCILQPAFQGFAMLPAGTTDARGDWRVDLELPAVKALIGAVLTAQNLVFTLNGPLLGIGELSDGLELTLGF